MVRSGTLNTVNMTRLPKASFCPSCMGRRRAEGGAAGRPCTAGGGCRQWVLSFSTPMAQYLGSATPWPPAVTTRRRSRYRRHRLPKPAITFREPPLLAADAGEVITVDLNAAEGFRRWHGGCRGGCRTRERQRGCWPRWSGRPARLRQRLAANAEVELVALTGSHGYEYKIPR